VNCRGTLHLDCPDENCDGILKTRQRKEDQGLFLGCSNYTTTNCRQAKNFETAIKLANEKLKNRNEKITENNYNAPIKDFSKVGPAVVEDPPF
jgi:hypothetical protein